MPRKWMPGQSGNPNGRPPKERALTNILEKSSKVKILQDGAEKPRAEVLADMIWQGLMSGIVSLPEGNRKLTLSPTDWKDFVKWIYGQVDGPPRQEMDVTTDGKPINRLSEGERLAKIIAILDKARDRAARQAANDGSDKSELQAPTKAG